MRFIPQDLPGLMVVELDLHRDGRGSFLETYHRRKFLEAGLTAEFVQDNQSSSAQGTLRGLHAQLKNPQGKLIRCLAGEIFDVAVDARPRSPAFGRWASVRLAAGDGRHFYIPPGFLHGFCILSGEAVVAYKCTAFYDPADELGVRWDDPDLGIAWPTGSPHLSPRDAGYPLFKDVREKLEAYRGIY